MLPLASIAQRCAPDVASLELLEAAPVGLLSIDGRDRIEVANAAAREWLGLAAQPALATATRLGPEERTRLQDWLDGKTAGLISLRTTDGRTLTVSRQRSGERSLLTVSPVNAAEKGPHCDPLTGLPDRKFFQERLAALCATAGSEVALMLIDLDRFKTVNDTLGHQAGDALLKLVAQRLRSVVRNADIVSRLGGDEFALAMEAGPGTTAIAERIVAVLSRPYLVERQSAVVGASVGVAIAPRHGTDAAKLTRAADLALYQAKEEGRGTVRMFDDALDQRARVRTALADDLRRAIPLQQLVLNFQPKLSLDTRRLTGFEALVRWHHPERGVVSPQNFIPMAEETGLILPLGEWVLQEACRQAAAWPGELTVAVNVSPSQLLDRERLPRKVAAALAASGLPARRLELEITESALINETEALEVMHKLQELGVSISMDDFGTGYSSLSQLRRFPFNKLKIDRSFVQGLGSDAEAAAVIRAVAALGRSLGMVTIAEGVETPEQETLCRDHGCTEMQGYLASRPVAGTDVLDLIQRFS